MQRWRVMIVEDSIVFSEFLSKITMQDGFEVCGVERNAVGAVECVQREKPDLILLDVNLPDMSGAKFLRRLIPQYAVPVIAVTAYKETLQMMMAAGAADFVLKPDDANIETFRRTLHDAMKHAMNLREVCCEGVVYKLRRPATRSGFGKLILIGGSAGSTEALPVILKGMGTKFPPIVCALHMPSGYTEMYAKRLSEDLSVEVMEARDGMELRSDSVVIAQGERHLRLILSGDKYYTNVYKGERISGHCPSIDVMFESAAMFDAHKYVAVLLTGMGHDGAQGLLKLRQAGAYTIGQDEKTSLVYGMPKAAFEMGAVEKQCALEDISRLILERTEVIK